MKNMTKHTLTSLLELASTPDGLRQIGDLTATLAGWEKRYSAAKREIRWYAPDAFNWLARPDFENDLNACAALRKGLTEEERERYGGWLAEVLDLNRPEVTPYAESGTLFIVADAEAYEHCISYILTKQPTKGAEQ